MTKYSYPFENTNMLEWQWQSMATWWFHNAVCYSLGNNLEVYADSTGMQVKVKDGQAFISGTFFYSTATEVLPIAAANPSLPRIDRVILKLDSAANKIDFAVLTGTPSSTPAAPSVGAGEMSLAQVYVGAGVTTIAADKITDERVFRARVPYHNSSNQLKYLRVASGGMGLEWAAAGAFYMSLNEVTIGTSATDVLSVSIPGGTLGTGGLLRVTIRGAINDGGQPYGANLKLIYGSTTLVDVGTGNWRTDAYSRPWTLTAYLGANGSATAQVGLVDFWSIGAVTTGDNYPVGLKTTNGKGTALENSANTLNLKIQIAKGSSSQTMIRYLALVEKVV